jgi:hypothetical protein
VPILTFLAVLVLTAAHRGLGFMQLGGAQIGGMSYVRLFIPLMLYIFAPYLSMDARKWKIALIGYCLIGLLPAIADMAFIFSGGAIHHIYHFVRPTGKVLTSLDALTMGSGIFRLRRLPHFELLLMGLILFRWQGASRILVTGMGLASLLLAGLTGFRLRIVELGLFVAALGYIGAGRRRAILVIKIAAVALVLLLVLALVTPHLPLAVQRSLSWLPFSGISHVATESAGATSQWRLHLWHAMLDMLPKYWLVGRGFAFGEAHVAEAWFLAGIDPHKVAYAIATHNYHNGPLGILIDLGILGLLVLSVIIILTLLHNYRACRQVWHDKALQWYHRLLLARYASLCLVWFGIYGDVRLMLHEMLMLMVIMDRLSVCGMHGEARQQEHDTSGAASVAANAAE